MSAFRASGDDAVEAGLEVALAAQTDDLVGHLPALKSSNVGMARTLYWPASAWLLSMFTLPILTRPSYSVGQLVQNRRDHLARAAPLGPEIHQHRRGGLEHFLREVLFC